MAFDAKPDGSTAARLRAALRVQRLRRGGFRDAQRKSRASSIPDVDKKTEGHGGNTAHGIAVTPDNKTLVANSSMNSVVYVYSLPDLKLLGQARGRALAELGHAHARRQVRLHLARRREQRRRDRHQGGEAGDRDQDRRPGPEAQRDDRDDAVEWQQGQKSEGRRSEGRKVQGARPSSRDRVSPSSLAALRTAFTRLRLSRVQPDLLQDLEIGRQGARRLPATGCRSGCRR